MSLWCDHTNLTTIPTPENLIGEFHAPPEKSNIIIFRKSCVQKIDPGKINIAASQYRHGGDTHLKASQQQYC